MGKNSDDKIPLTQSPSITQETKARFNELLNAALSREAEVFKENTSNTAIIRSAEKVPKALPRQKLPAKLPEDDIPKIVSSIYSSEESGDNNQVMRQVVAEVHNSRTHLLLSSSDDDILAEKKEKRKKKKSRWKQVTEPDPLVKEDGQDNVCFHIDSEVDKERNSSRLSNKSYVIESSNHPADETKTVTSKIKIEKNYPSKDNNTEKSSPSCTSNKSYVVENPVFALEDKPVLPKVKTPIPLPRRKSLKVIPDADENTKSQGFVENHKSEKEKCETVITIDDYATQGTDEDLTMNSVVELHKSNFVGTAEDSEMPLAVRKQKRKKRRKYSKSREEIELQELNVEQAVEGRATSEESFIQRICEGDAIRDGDSEVHGEKILSVVIHGVDCPLVHPLVCHPVVRLFVVDTSSGEFYRKSEPQRSVCYLGEDTNYIPPIMTHPYHFKQHRSVTPQWEEELLLNESVSHLLTPHTLLLFEVCDFVPAAEASARYSSLGPMAAWHTEAWAFLRPVPTTGRVNTAARMRLQLYKPVRRPRAIRSLTPVVYEWWGTADRQRYPGCLYVTVAAVQPPPTPLSPRLRSRSALQAEQGSMASVRSASAASSELNLEENRDVQEEKQKEPVAWSRLMSQSCKVPNFCLSSLPVEGSMSVQFSPDGLWLACAKQDIHLYSIPQCRHAVTLMGHQGLVYSLRWSRDSKVLLSASADCTVRVWKPGHRRAPLLQMLAHPSYVYCCEIVPMSSCLAVVSGCYDSILRLWRGETHTSYALSQELSGHSGFVSSICVTSDGTRVVSADSRGGIRVYDVDEDGGLSGARDLRVREVRGTTINNLKAHPGGHRLIVHSRDSLLRSVDLVTGAVLQTFKGCKNDRLQMGMTVSACGGLVFACGEDGSVVAWNAQTGNLRAVYLALLPPGCATVHYHPHDHILALAPQDQIPVYILGFDRKASGEDIGLTSVKNEITPADVIEKMKFMQKANKWQKAASKIIPSSPQTPVPVHVVVNERKKKGSNKLEVNEKPTQHMEWPSLPQVCSQKSPNDKDTRLLEIIQKMDSMILAAKQTSQS